jgi:hypothetical protein
MVTPEMYRRQEFATIDITLKSRFHLSATLRDSLLGAARFAGARGESRRMPQRKHH